MFKNAVIFKATGPIVLDLDALYDNAFQPCHATQLSSMGWVKPDPNDEEMVSTRPGGEMIMLQREEKIIPNHVISQRVKETVEAVEREQARKVGRKERLQIKDDAVLDLLPRAFSRISTTRAMFLNNGWIIVDAGTHKPAEELLNCLRNTLTTLPVCMPQPVRSPSAEMTSWLFSTELIPAGFAVADCVQLKQPAQRSNTIRCTEQDLYGEEVKAHLEAGKHVEEMKIHYDDALTFTLTADLQIKQLKSHTEVEDHADASAYDAEFALMVLEFGRLVPALLAAFGGEVKR